MGGRRVTVTDVTGAWAVIAVAGPSSRKTLLEVLGDAWRPAIERLNHMELAVGRFGAFELTILRAGFSGELAFELHVRPGGAVSLWQALVDAGLAPYGLDALDILRVEKGYLTSSEINGETTPFDLNMDAQLRSRNPCVGRELLDRPAFLEPARPRLVGLRAANRSDEFRAGAQLTSDATASTTLRLHHVSCVQPRAGTVGRARSCRPVARERRRRTEGARSAAGPRHGRVRVFAGTRRSAGRAHEIMTVDHQASVVSTRSPADAARARIRHVAGAAAPARTRLALRAGCRATCR